jgi:hypothetical protein
MTFKTSQASIQERQRLILEIRLAAALALGIACLAASAWPPYARLACWAAAALLALGILRLKPRALLASLEGRELRIQEQALELVRGNFTRLLFYNQLEQLRMIQGPGEKVLALQLRTLDGSVVLRGYENMEALFTALMSRKPPRVLLEVEESRYDWHSLLLWSRLAYLAGAFIFLACYLSGAF